MPLTNKPLPFDQLDAKPPLTGQQRVSEDMQQTLALLTGFNGSQRKLVIVTQEGILIVASVRPKGTINIAATSPDYIWSGDDIKCNEVKVIAHPDNSNRVWVNIDSNAGNNIGEPLDAGDHLVWGIENLKNLHITIMASGEKAIVVYG